MDVLEVRFESGFAMNYVVVMTNSGQEKPLSKDLIMFADGVLHASAISTYIPIRSEEGRYVNFYTTELQYINKCSPLKSNGITSAYATDAWQYAIESMYPIPHGNIKEVL